MMTTESSTRAELMLEVIKAAADRISVQDFNIQCQLTPATLGKSYYDRLRVAERLIEQGVIGKIDEHLQVLATQVPDWLKNDLLSGSEISWKIFEAIDIKRKLEGKIDHELLRDIGLDGEKEVVRQLHLTLPPYATPRVKHISLTDDCAGFDISSPSTIDNDLTYLLEVKTSSRPGEDFRFFISRNEARVASLNENWRLLAVRRQPSGYKILGHLRYAHISNTLPVDSNPFAKWESASIIYPVNQIVPGLP